MPVEYVVLTAAAAILLALLVAVLILRRRITSLVRPHAPGIVSPMRVFICYRREDAGGYAGRLYDQLSARFGAENVFMDVTAIKPGADFVSNVETAVVSSDAVVVIIGPSWLTARSADGTRRIDDPNDYVRQEITSGLTHDRQVIPVLVNRAIMPGATDLPEPIRLLARRNALELSESHWRADVDTLVGAVRTSAPDAVRIAKVPPKVPPKVLAEIPGDQTKPRILRFAFVPGPPWVPVAAASVVLVALGAVFGLILYRVPSQLSPAGSKGTIEIGSDMNITGDELLGLPVQYGAAFAVARTQSVRGFTLKFVPLDDAVKGHYSVDKGAQNVQQFISDVRVLGMVGPIESVLAKAEIPLANRAGLAMISPTNTSPCLTQTPDQRVIDWCAKLGGPSAADLRPSGRNNYFRIPAADTFLGPAMADFAYDTLRLRTIAVWDDERQGVIQADTFTTEFTKRGGTVVARQGFDTTTRPDFHAWLTVAKAAGAEAIFAGAFPTTFACVPRGESVGIFDPGSYYLGPNGFFSLPDQECAADADPMANSHMYASSGLGDANLNAGATATIAAYYKLHPKPSDTNAFTWAGYDIAAILIDAIGRAIDADDGRMPTRLQVIDQLARTNNFVGLAGTYTFNPNGDLTAPTLQILQYSGAWSPIKNVTVASS